MVENLIKEFMSSLEKKFEELETKFEGLRNQVDTVRAEDGLVRVDDTGEIFSAKSVTKSPFALITDQALMPQRFKGENIDYYVENFKFAVEMWLANRLGSDACVDDYDIISWIGNLFGGKAGRWWSRLGLLRKNQAPGHRCNLEEFWVELRHVFGERKLPFSDELDLFNLKQEKLTISEFDAQFRQLASCVDWSREKLEAALYLSKLNSYFIGRLKNSPPIPSNVNRMMESTELADPQFMPFLGHSSGTVELPRRIVHTGSVKKPEPRCYNCDKVGHIKPNCPLLNNRPKIGTTAMSSSGNTWQGASHPSNLDYSVEMLSRTV